MSGTHEVITERNEKNRPERFLVGEDDGQTFKVRVPLRVKSVEQAIKWLRPAGVPADAPRQGEYFFVPQAEGFKPSSLRDETYTEAGSYREVVVEDGPLSFHRHAIARCPDLAEDAKISRAAQARGSTCFIGRKRVCSHDWTGRPRYFVRGQVEHPEHGTLVLGSRWHEVVPNRAHGPFPVRGLGAGLD